MVMQTNLFTIKGFQLFLKKVFLFIILLLAMDFLLGSLLRKFYFTQQSGPDYETRYAMEEASEKLLIFGSSRARHHYYPPAFEEALNLNSYNAGRNGNFILYSNAVLQSVLKRHTPEIVVLDIVKHEFEDYPPAYEHLSVLLPYYKDHPEIRSTLLQRSKFERIKLWSAIYPFNSSLVSISLGNSEFNKGREKVIQGYGPLSRELTSEPPAENSGTEYKIDSNMVKTFEKFIVSCKAAGVKVFVVCSPYYYPLTEQDPSLEIAKKIAAQEEVPFMDFSRDTLFSGKLGNFYDYDHLNHEAAIRYSAIIADTIRKQLPIVAKQ